jgi:hypothetical protein
MVHPRIGGKENIVSVQLADTAFIPDGKRWFMVFQMN